MIFVHRRATARGIRQDCVHIGGKRIEILPGKRPRRLQITRVPGQAAAAAGLGVNAGHDLNRDNLTEFVREVPGVLEVSIGHAFVADALELGYATTTRSYLNCITRAFAAV